MREGESHGKAVAHHILNKMTIKETILTESKFMIAEIAETIVGTQTSETHVHWDIIEVWDANLPIVCQSHVLYWTWSNLGLWTWSNPYDWTKFNLL